MKSCLQYENSKYPEGIEEFRIHEVLMELSDPALLSQYNSYTEYQYLERLRNSIRLQYPELWSLRMAIYLHDIGMFINPRYWHKLGVPKDGLSPPGEDLIADLEEDAIVKSLLESLGMGFEDAFFDENGCLRLPPPLKEKPWDEFSFIEKTAM
ncbi:MAG: hypothetical protein QXR84_08275, partial [Candidatus Bathyarchaeia archaeon]